MCVCVCVLDNGNIWSNLDGANLQIWFRQYYLNKQFIVDLRILLNIILHLELGTANEGFDLELRHTIIFSIFAMIN